MSKRKKITVIIVIVLLLILVATVILPIIATTKVEVYKGTTEQQQSENNLVEKEEVKLNTNLETINFGSYLSENKDIEEMLQDNTEKKNEANMEKTEMSESENTSEAYLKWTELSEKEKQNTIEPRKEYIDISELKTNKQYVMSNTTIPEEYNLREVLNEIKTESQESFGNCYAYAGLNLIETNIAIKTGTIYDFSEIHIEYMTSTLLGGNRTLNSGGNFQTVIQYSDDLQGPVLESEVINKTYTEEEYTLLRNAKPIISVTETIEFPTIDKRYGYTEEEMTEFRDSVKTHIMENGSVYSSIYFSQSDKYYNSSTKGYACLGSSILTNHAVSIIGWDDNYSKENFPEPNKPINNGAWIALNSHGSSFGDNGVFYISYEDNWVEYNMSGVVSTTEFVDTYGPKVELTNYTNENNIITATINVYDIGGSGIDTLSLKYQWTQTSEKPTLESFSTSFTNGETLSKTFEEGEQWYLWILAYDTQNNYTISGAVRELIFGDKNFYNALCYVLSDSIITSKENEDSTYSIFMSQDAIENITTLSLKSHSDYPLPNHNVTDQIYEIDGIENFINLKKLVLSSNNISSIDNIKFPSGLEYLALRSNRLTSIDKAVFPIGLEYLDLGANKLTAINNVVFPAELKVLDLDQNFDLIEINAELPNNLEELSLYRLDKMKNWENIRLPQNLKKLYLASCDLGETIEKMELPETLTELFIGDNGITNIECLSHLTNLEQLCVGANQISDISVIENFSKLEIFQAGDTYALFTMGIGHFGEQTNQISNINNITFPNNLQKIDLGYNKITDVSEANWPDYLECLYLDNNLIQNITIEMGQHFYYLDLSNNKIRDISKIKISDRCSNARGLDLSNNEIESIPNEIWGESKIVSLILSNNKISNIYNVIWPKDLDSLALNGNNISFLDGTTWNNKLRILTLSDNNISEIKNVTWPESLQALEIVKNNITELSWIENGTNLVAIALNENNIYDLESLLKLSKMRELHLDDNHIEDISILENLSNLSYLSIKNQEILRVIDSDTTEIELPQLLKQTMISTSKVYTENEMIVRNCTIEENYIKYSIDKSGYIYAMVYGGNAGGTTVLITGSANDAFFKDTYTVYNKEDLIKVMYINNYAGNLSNSNIELANDIDLGGYYNEESGAWEGEEWIPIGTKENPFSATLDGKGHKIEGIYINTDLDNQGFIGYNQGNIKNLGIETGYIKSTGDNIGGIIGHNDNWYSGDTKPTIKNCYNKATIIGGDSVGGISGQNKSTTRDNKIIDCFNEGTIRGSFCVGGIVGRIYGSSVIDKCYNSGDIKSYSKCGGIVGDISNWLSSFTKISNCFNKGSTTVNGNYVGGIVGNFGCESKEDIVINCYNIGDIGWKQKSNSGEIAGQKEDKATIKNCYYSNTSEIKATGGQEDKENNVYGLTEEEMYMIGFVKLLNSGNEEIVWKIGDSNYPYPMLAWQEYTGEILPEKELTSISISNMPDKTTYEDGENFEAEGMIIVATYDDGSTQETMNYTVLNGENLNCLVKEIEIQSNENSEIKVTIDINVAHNMNEETCTENKKCITNGCTYSEGEALGHSYTNYVSNNDATCTEDGTKTAKCDRCDEVDTTTDEGSKLGHNYESVVTPATCTEGGHTTHTCTRCDNTYVDSETEALNHSFTNYISNDDATCTVDGTKTAKCDRCDEVDTIEDEGSKLGHDYESVVTPATCTEGGYTTHTCTRCDDSYVDSETSALNHSFTNYVSNDDATCTEDGTKTAKCDRCDEKDTITDQGSKKGHNYVDGECTECGNKETRLEITSQKYKIEDMYISKIQEKTTVAKLKENLQTNAEINIYNKKGELQEETKQLATGMQVELKLGSQTQIFIIAVSGDVNEDGKANFTDMLIVNRYRLRKQTLEGANFIAADVTEDGKVEFIDLIKINRFRLHKITEL